MAKMMFDEYGNYKYPSDVELPEPNTATSMPCEEAISRQGTIDAMIKRFDGENARDEFWNCDMVMGVLRDMPPANPQPKWIPLSDDIIKNGVDVLLKATDGDIYKTHLSITGTLPDGNEEELKNIEAFMIIKFK